MSHNLAAMNEIRAINKGFPYPEPMRRWKEKGRRIVGWGCSYVPEEILRAAGCLPIRVTGDACEIPTDDGDAHLYINTCSYARTILQLGLDGQYDFLDGYVTTASCDGMRRLMDYWRLYVRQTPFLHIMSLPRRVTPRAEAFFLGELQEFKGQVEQHFGVAITDDSLREAIATHNRTRSLLRELFEMRRSPHPPITGAESFEIVLAGVRMPRDEYNTLLARLIEQAQSHLGDGKPKTRLMISGSNLANPGFVACLESQGAVVVADDLCTGARYWCDPVDESLASSDPMQALARRYLHNLPCARTVGLADERHDRILGHAKEYNVQGLVNAVIRNCSPNSMDRPLLREKFEATGIPVLELDTEYGTGHTGQVATRVQAFLEMIQAMSE